MPRSGGAFSWRNAIAVRQAWELHAAGKRDAARDLLRLRLAQADGGDGKNSPALADLLVALADMREVALEVGPAVESYRRAATIRGTALGDPHPATITAALRLAGVGVAGGVAMPAKGGGDHDGETFPSFVKCIGSQGRPKASATAR